MQSSLQQLATWVAAYRKAKDITPTPGPKSELSGIAHGEGFVLLVSLVKTVNGTGAWTQLTEELAADAYAARTRLGEAEYA